MCKISAKEANIETNNKFLSITCYTGLSSAFAERLALDVCDISSSVSTERGKYHHLFSNYVVLSCPVSQNCYANSRQTNQQNCAIWPCGIVDSLKAFVIHEYFTKAQQEGHFQASLLCRHHYAESLFGILSDIQEINTPIEAFHSSFISLYQRQSTFILPSKMVHTKEQVTVARRFLSLRVS